MVFPVLYVTSDATADLAAMLHALQKVYQATRDKPTNRPTDISPAAFHYPSSEHLMR